MKVTRVDRKNGTITIEFAQPPAQRYAGAFFIDADGVVDLGDGARVDAGPLRAALADYAARREEQAK